MKVNAADSLKLASSVHAFTVDAEDMEEAHPGFRRLDHDAMRRGAPVAPRLEMQHAIARAVEDGVVTVRAQAMGSNKVLKQGITAELLAWKNKTAFYPTHMDLGESNVAPTEDDTGNNAHVDASAGTPRIPITDMVPTGKTIRVTGIAASGEYVGRALKEICLCTAATGQNAYNHALLTSTLNKQNGQIATFIFDHTRNN